jgi:hypothetical protein
MELQSIDPGVLAALAEKAIQEEKRMRNPYLKALMVRLNRLALELKTALEKEGGTDRTQACSGSNGQGYEAPAINQENNSPPPVHDSGMQNLDDQGATERRRGEC